MCVGSCQQDYLHAASILSLSYPTLESCCSDHQNQVISHVLPHADQLEHSRQAFSSLRAAVEGERGKSPYPTFEDLILFSPCPRNCPESRDATFDRHGFANLSIVLSDIVR